MAKRKKRPAGSPTVPATRYIVDGYNLLFRCYGAPLGLQQGRDALHRELRDLAHRKRWEILIVWDGETGVSHPDDPRLKPLTILYTLSEQTADEWLIARMRRYLAEAEPDPPTVVTTDIKDIWSALECEGAPLMRVEQFKALAAASQPRERAGSALPAGSHVHVSSGEVDELARQFAAGGPDQIRLSDHAEQRKPSRRQRAAVPAPAGPSAMPPSQETGPARNAEGTGDSRQAENEVDFWERTFLEAGAAPDMRTLGTRERQEKRSIKAPKKAPGGKPQTANPSVPTPERNAPTTRRIRKDVPDPGDLDAWEDLFGG